MSTKLSSQRSVLQSLNLFGLDHLDSVILAALADEKPLLLIGSHGTAKSELLNRVAASLGLEHRHYNASLISFDDLIGYPVPNDDKTALQYLHTPGDIWSAESVFLDEISRCKPEHQNRLFSIIHERRIQGLALPRLRYRWSAMNPPPSIDGEEDDNHYLGALPLDTALADRFAYIARVPALEKISVQNRLRIIKEGSHFNPDNPLSELVAEAKAKLRAVTDEQRNWAAHYVNALVIPLKEAGFGISGRRVVSLASTVLSVFAAEQVLDPATTIAESAFIAFRSGLPHVAQGADIRQSLVRTIHNGAVKVAGTPEYGFWSCLREEIDPVKRVRLALDAGAEQCNRHQFSQIVSDAWSGLSRPEQYLFARNLLPAINGERLNANTLEVLLEPLERVTQFVDGDAQTYQKSRTQAQEWDALQKVILKLKTSNDPAQLSLGNIFYTLYLVEGEQILPAKLIAIDAKWRSLFQGKRRLRKSA